MFLSAAAARVRRKLRYVWGVAAADTRIGKQRQKLTGTYCVVIFVCARAHETTRRRARVEQSENYIFTSFSGLAHGCLIKTQSMKIKTRDKPSLFPSLCFYTCVISGMKNLIKFTSVFSSHLKELKRRWTNRDDSNSYNSDRYEMRIFRLR